MAINLEKQIIDLHKHISTINEKIAAANKISKLEKDNKEHAENLALRLDCLFQIDAIARRIMSTPFTEKDRRQLLVNLITLRNRLILHIPVNQIKGNIIFFNLAQPMLAPAPLCPAYNKMQIPTLSNYQNIGSNIACIRLDSTALTHVPKDVLKHVDLTDKQLDLFWVAIDGREQGITYPSPYERSLNLCTHSWSQPHILDGDDVHFDVNMGIFPEIGFERSQDAGAIAVNGISPMNVHCHPRGAQGSEMLYSPDNAHFEYIKKSPFGILWAISQKDNRVAITKMLVIFDYNHPLSKPLIASIKSDFDLTAHLQQLKLVSKSIDEYFAPVLHAKNYEQMKAMFEKLPLSFQKGIHGEIWKLFGSPVGIHNDFGKASLEQDPSLKVEQRCDEKTLRLAIQHFANQLRFLLLDSQIELTQSQPLILGDNILKMMRCARQFYTAPQQAKDTFYHTFSPEEQEATRYAIWQLSKCPRGDDQFGNKEINNSSPFSAVKKAEAVLLASSRQPHRFDPPLITAPTLEETQSKPILLQSNNNNKTSTSPSPAPTPPAPAATLPVITPEQIKEQVLNLMGIEGYHEWSNEDKAMQMNQIFSQLPKKLTAEIHARVYANSNDPQKNGWGWGGAENHIADDPGVLLDSFDEAVEIWKKNR